MKNYFVGSWEFIMPVGSIDQLPVHNGLEIAFAGRSNVGKSSLLNALTDHGKLARISNTPGRTQTLNFFEKPNNPFMLVDMPGYGYAKAPKKMVDGWNYLIIDYLKGRAQLSAVCLLIDARHGAMKTDKLVMDILKDAGVFFQPILTKCDKITPKMVERVRADLAKLCAKNAAASPNIIASSSQDKTGIDDIRQALCLKLGLPTNV